MFSFLIKGRPVGIRVHLTGNQEMGMEAEGKIREVRDVGSLRHMPVEREWEAMEWRSQMGRRVFIERRGKEGKKAEAIRFLREQQ